MALRSYDAARVDPQGGNWFPMQNATPEMTDAPHRGLVRGRMRDMERNGDVTEGIIDAIVRNVVEGGFGLEARAMSARGKPLDAVNDRIEELWNKWSQAENCDVTGDSSFGELLEIIVRRWEVDGEIFILKVVDLRVSCLLSSSCLSRTCLPRTYFRATAIMFSAASKWTST